MAKAQKSLQKVTDSDEPKDESELIKRLISQQKPLPDNATPTERQNNKDAFFCGLLESPLVSEETKEDLRNQTWEGNHDELTRVIGNLIHETGRMPTVTRLSTETGLSRQTIHKHLSEFYQSARYQNRLSLARMLSDRLLDKLYQSAIDGDVRAAKVFLDAVGGLPVAPAPAAGNNYIQVNNNV
ncbi:MAG: hypothetical protein JWP57_3710, partial [Spirosoma sp.]|nr:hypothetical protein [Spirosoma sp.]